MTINGNEKLRRMINSQQIICDFAGTATVGTEWRADSVCSTFTRIYQIESGEAVLTDKSGEYHLCKGDIAVVPTGVRFSYRSLGTLKKYYYHIRYPFNTGDFFTGLPCIFMIKNMKYKPKLPLDSALVFDAIEVQCYLYEIVSQCLSHTMFCKDSLYRNCSALTESAILFIENNLFSQPKVTQVAEALSVSLSNLQKHFYREVGVSVGNYMRERLMAVAEQYVAHTMLSICEISEQLGFADEFYFSNVFKKKFGLSPAKYRKKGY